MSGTRKRRNASPIAVNKPSWPEPPARATLVRAEGGVKMAPDSKLKDKA
jgi:hypothetical protein